MYQKNDLVVFEENFKDLREWFDNNWSVKHNKNRILGAIYRSGIKDIKELENNVRNGIKIKGISKHYSMKILKEYFDEKLEDEYIKKPNEEFDEDLNEESEENNLEDIRNLKKSIIKDYYIELIKNELSIVEDKLSKGIGDEDLEDLHKVYVILRTIL